MDTNNDRTAQKPMQMNREQRAARIALFFDLREPLTKAEAVAALDTPYAAWPESLKQKTGPLGELVRIEDERATAPSPGK